MNSGSFKNVTNKLFVSKSYIAESAGAVEYTYCISAEGQNFPYKCPGYDTKQSDG